MSDSYVRLAQVYDRFMIEAPYDQWLDYAEGEWSHFQLAPKKVLELACGTGSISVRLAKKGYQTFGIDLSSDMLTMAQDKADQADVDLQLFRQDMSSFISPEPMDSIVCFCDSINYLIDPQAVLQTFEQAFKYLIPGGVFLFDVHSLYKIKQVFGSESFHWIEDDLVYLWDSQEEESDQITHFLTIFIKQGEVYRRFEETHQQRGYSQQQILDWLVLAGFTNVRCHADFKQTPLNDTSERLFFSCQKPAKSSPL